MLKQAIATIKARALEAFLVALGTALPAWLLLAESHLVQYVSTLAPTTIVRIVAVSIAIAAYSWAAFFWLRPKLIFDKTLGIYFDRKTNNPYCPSCYAKKKLSPLKEQNHGWSCMVKDCKTYIRNPSHKPKAIPAPMPFEHANPFLRHWDRP
jgi:hypothetical protein